MHFLALGYSYRLLDGHLKSHSTLSCQHLLPCNHVKLKQISKNVLVDILPQKIVFSTTFVHFSTMDKAKALAIISFSLPFTGAGILPSS